jgi:hypothetical protein
VGIERAIAVLVDAMKHGSHDIERIPPAERGRLAAVLRWCAAEMDPLRASPKAGVLLELQGTRQD